ncbi:trypsin-like serine protease [Aliivibrio wodanis]|uniref:trypsin-like serine protease n=1 Tax=Aliivibrio wodanis TaxID=80852 RepID=UPI00406C9D46
MKKALLLLTLCSSSALAIVDGQPLDWKSDYTNMATISCTGTLIGGKYLLTAGHCFGSPIVRFSNYDFINVLAHTSHPDEALDTFSPDIAIWELERAHDTKDIRYVANLNSDPIAVGDTVTMYGFGGTAQLKKGHSRIVNDASDAGFNFRYLYESVDTGNGYLQGGDSGGPWTNSAGDIVGVSSTVRENHSMTATRLAPIKDWFLSEINAWHYPSLAYVNGTATITIQSLHSDAGGVDFSVESNVTGASIISEQSTCLTKEKILPFEKCTIVVESNGGEGTIQLSNNEFIKLNKPEPLPEVMPTPDSGGKDGGSLGFLSIIGLLGLGFIRRK